jgi:hypothetical protein
VQEDKGKSLQFNGGKEKGPKSIISSQLSFSYKDNTQSQYRGKQDKKLYKAFLKKVYYDEIPIVKI